MPRTTTTGTSTTSPPSSSSSSSPFDHRLSYRLTEASWDTAGDTPGPRCAHKERRKKKPSQALVVSFALAESKPSSSPSRSWSPIPPKLPFLPYFFPFETLNRHRSPILCHRRPLSAIKNRRGIRRPLRIPSDFSGGGSAAGEGGEGGGVGGGGGGGEEKISTYPDWLYEYSLLSHRFFYALIVARAWNFYNRKFLGFFSGLRFSKVCEPGVLNYKSKHVFYHWEKRRFLCRDDYYWASVFEQWKFEATSMWRKIEFLEVSKRKLLDESLESCSVEELQEIEDKLEQSLRSIRERKNRLLGEQIVQLKEQELTLMEENALLREKQSEGSAVWIPAAAGRDISTLQASSFYSLPPQGQHMTFTPTQAGHGGFSGIYQPTPTVAAAAVHPLLQQSQTVAGAVEMVGPPSGVYQQPQRAQVNWTNNY